MCPTVTTPLPPRFCFTSSRRPYISIILKVADASAGKFTCRRKAPELGLGDASNVKVFSSVSANGLDVVLAAVVLASCASVVNF